MDCIGIATLEIEAVASLADKGSLVGHARDYDELPKLVTDGIAVRFVSRLDEVLTAAGLLVKPSRAAPRQVPARKKPRAR